MKLMRPFAMAAGVIVLATPFWSMAEPYTMTPNQSSVQAKWPNSGNNAAQGRYYDVNDDYVDAQSGLPVAGAPVLKDSGGGGGD